MTTEEILEQLDETYGAGELIYADGFEEALLGTVVGALRAAVTCYDYDKCVEILVAQGMDEQTAEEHLDFNSVGAFVGELTPLFLHNLRAAKKNDDD